MGGWGGWGGWRGWGGWGPAGDTCETGVVDSDPSAIGVTTGVAAGIMAIFYVRSTTNYIYKHTRHDVYIVTYTFSRENTLLEHVPLINTQYIEH